MTAPRGPTRSKCSDKEPALFRRRKVQRSSRGPFTFSLSSSILSRPRKQRLFCAVCCLSLLSVPALAQAKHVEKGATAKGGMTDQPLPDLADPVVSKAILLDNIWVLATEWCSQCDRPSDEPYFVVARPGRKKSLVAMVDEPTGTATAATAYRRRLCPKHFWRMSSKPAQPLTNGHKR